MQVSYLKRKQNLSRNKTYTHSFIIFPPLFTAFYCSQTIEMFTNIFLCKPFVTKITPFTARIEVQPDSCSSFQTNLCVFEQVLPPLYISLSVNIATEGDDRAEGTSLRLCTRTQQKWEVGCLMLRVN